MSKVYVSHKRVIPFPMNRACYNIYRGWELPEGENGNDQGYLVEYLDGGDGNHPDHEGYISWSPKAQFDNGYTEEVEVDSNGITYAKEVSIHVKSSLVKELIQRDCKLDVDKLDEIYKWIIK